MSAAASSPKPSAAIAVSSPVRSLKWWAGAACETAGAAGEVAQAQCGGAVGGDDVQRGAEDGAAQVAVVVPAGASSVFFGSVGLMGSSVRSI